MTETDPFADKTFDSLDAMMEAYAGAAVKAARTKHGIVLDYSLDSIALLEKLLDALNAPVGAESEAVTKLWGGYFGEVLRRGYQGSWAMTVYPGAEVAVPTLEIGGSRLYPLTKVFRRLTMGRSESLDDFLKKVQERLPPGGMVH